MYSTTWLLSSAGFLFFLRGKSRSGKSSKNPFPISTSVFYLIPLRDLLSQCSPLASDMKPAQILKDRTALTCDFVSTSSKSMYLQNKKTRIKQSSNLSQNQVYTSNFVKRIFTVCHALIFRSILIMSPLSKCFSAIRAMPENITQKQNWWIYAVFSRI